MQNLNDNAIVIENRRILENSKLYDMVLECPEISDSAKPGQIVHIKCGDGTTLRRPISICECLPDGSIRL